MKPVHQLDRRDLLIWDVDIQDPAFLVDYNAEREFWEAGGKKRGAMDSTILYLLAKKHRKAESIDEDAEIEKMLAEDATKKELQTA